MGEAGDATDVYLRAFFTILKPGGILAVEQHRAPKGADPRAGSGYVPESYVIDATRKAGFTLDAKSEVNANPSTRRTIRSASGPCRRPTVARPRANRQTRISTIAKYDAIGESDRMTLKFRKPE